MFYFLLNQFYLNYDWTTQTTFLEPNRPVESNSIKQRHSGVKSAQDWHSSWFARLRSNSLREKASPHHRSLLEHHLVALCKAAQSDPRSLVNKNSGGICGTPRSQIKNSRPFQYSESKIGSEKGDPLHLEGHTDQSVCVRGWSTTSS